MARLKVGMLMVVALVCCCCTGEAWEGQEEEDKKSIINVSGKVLCQDCTKTYNDWIHGARPITGGKVSITCMSNRRRVVYYGSAETDSAGGFNIVLPKYIYGNKELNAENCRVRVVSSPDSACNIPTDFSGGRSGVKLRAPSHVYRDFIKYTVGPFYYTSPMCDDPLDE